MSDGAPTPAAPASTLDEVLAPDRVPIVAADGTLVSVPQANLGAALAKGYQQQSPEQQEQFYKQLKFGKSPVRAAVEGAASGVTLGLSDLVLPELGISSREGISARREANPKAAIAGEVAGMLVDPIGAVGAVSRVGKAAKAAVVGEKVAAGVGRKLAGSVAGGMVEGAIFSAGQAVSEASLGDTDLNAQKLAGTLGLGALIGGAAGGLGGAIEAGVGAATKLATKGRGLQGAVQDMADKQTLKAAGLMSKDFKKAAYKGVEADMAAALREQAIVTPGASLEVIAERAASKSSDLGKRLGDIIDTATEKGGTSAMVDGAELAARIRKDVVSPLSRTNAADKALASRLEAEAVNLESKGAMNLRQAEEYKRSFDKYLDFGAEQKPLQEGLKDIRRILKRGVEDKLESLSGSVAPGLAEEFKQTKKLYGLISEAAEISAERAAAIKSNLTVSLTDRMAGMGFGALAGGPMGLATGAAAALGNKLLRERGSSVAGHLLDSLANSPIFSQVAQSFGSAVQKPLQAGMFGKYAPMLANAFGKSPMEGLLAHIQLANENPEYVQVAAAAGFPVMEPERHGEVRDAAVHLSTLKDMLAEHDAEVVRGVEKVLSGARAPRTSLGVHDKQDFGAKRQRKTLLDAHQTHARQVMELAADPHALVDKLSQNLGAVGKHAPATAAGISATASRAVQFLAGKVQRPPPGGPLAPEWHPSDAEVASFARSLEVAQKPMSALKHAAAGTLTKEHVEALQAVYPGLHQQIRAAIVDKLTDKPKGMPYARRVQLAMLAGVDPDGTLNPKAVMKAQAAFHRPSAKPAENQLGGAVKPTSAGASKLTVANRMRTPMQASANRGER